MNIEDLQQYILLLPMVAGLIVGAVIKHTPALDKVANGFIPLIVTVLGAVVGAISVGVSLEGIIYGAMSGLASTGLHQMFSRFIGMEEEK